MFKTILSMSVLCTLTGCVTTSGGINNNRWLNTHTPVNYALVKINGIPLTPTTAMDFPMGKFKGFPLITRKADFAALDQMTKGYAVAAWEAAGRQDWESFAVNRHLGMRLAEYRLHQKIATTDFVESLVKRGDGAGVLAPGATIFLPGFARYGDSGTTPQRVSSIAPDDMFASSKVMFEPDWASAPKTADISDMLGIIQKTANMMTDATRVGGEVQVAAQKKANEMLAELPIGQVFSARDNNGNSYLVERTDEGFIVSNPGNRPTTIPLGQFGFIPEMPLPNEVRRNAAPLVMHMQEARHTLFWQAVGTTGLRILASTQAPNRIVIQNSRVSGFLDANGDLAQDGGQSGAVAYQTNPSYRIALEMANFAAHENPDFKLQCSSNMQGRANDTTYVGANAEILRHDCFDGNRQPIFSRSFYVAADGKTMQTFESLMQDKQIAKRLQDADASRDLVESVVGFIPTVGNIDSASKCLTGTSITVWSSRTINQMRRGSEEYRAFVSDLIPNSPDPTTLSKSLTCAAAIPAFGTATKAVAKAGNWIGGYKAWATSEKAREAFAALAFFDTDVLAVGNTAAMGNLHVAEKSMQTMKGFYDSLQIAQGGVGLGNATTTVLQN